MVLEVGKKIKHPSLGVGTIVKHQKRDKWTGLFGGLQITFSEKDLQQHLVVDVSSPMETSSKSQKDRNKEITSAESQL